MANCPPFLIVFAVERLKFFAESFHIDDRPWYLRLLVNKEKPVGPPRLVSVRLFSEYESDKIDCGGCVLAHWSVYLGLHGIEVNQDQTELVPGINPPENAGLATYLQEIVLNCAISPDGKLCVILEIDLEGMIRKGVYELKNGVDSDRLGAIVGGVVNERMKRHRWDSCLPSGWKPH